MSIYVTSDLHLNDPQILNLRTNFNSMEEHDKYVIEKYNSVVGKDDLVYILGDVGFKPKDKLATLVKQLNGRKILILGNHDQLTIGEYRNMGFIDVIDHPVYYSNNIILCHEPVKECFKNPWTICVHGHLHGTRILLDNYINVTVEDNNYLPININVLKFRASSCRQNRWEPFKKEWYSDYQEITR